MPFGNLVELSSFLSHCHLHVFCCFSQTGHFYGFTADGESVTFRSYFLFNTLVFLYHQKLGGWGLERNCSFLSLPFICMIICLCRRNLPLEIQDSVAYSLFSLTFPALSFVALPLTVSSISLLSNSPSVIDCCSPSSY